MRLQSIAPIAFAATLAFAVAACQPASTDGAHEEAATPYTQPALGEFTTAAKINSITDAGYPMFVVSAQFPDRATPVEIRLNNEDVDLGGVAYASYVGKDVSLTYVVKAENYLFDLRDGDLSLVPRAPGRASHWKEVTGVLSGAEQATVSDLPGTIAITDASGAKVEFEYFVSPQIAAANGKQVTAWYAPGAAQYVKSMRPAATAAK